MVGQGVCHSHKPLSYSVIRQACPGKHVRKRTMGDTQRTVISLGPQAFYRVGACGPDRLKTDRQESYSNGKDAG